MLKSMTGYGKGSQETPLGLLVCEIHAVNRKFLDTNLYLSKELFAFDIPLRKWVTQNIPRGQVTLKAFFRLDHDEKTPYSLDSLKEIKNQWSHIARELGFAPEKEISLSFLLQQYQLDNHLDSDDEKTIEKHLFLAFEDALSHFNAMKKTEGTALEQEIKSHLKSIEKPLLKIKDNAPQAVDKYRLKLQERLKEFSQDSTLDERILREVALFAEKIDITEELARLDSHLDQFYHTLKTDQKSYGKELEFLVQEMHREINTVSSKVSDIDLTKCTLEIKSELEKIKEQIQNVE